MAEIRLTPPRRARRLGVGVSCGSWQTMVVASLTRAGVDDEVVVQLMVSIDLFHFRSEMWRIGSAEATSLSWP